MPEIPASRGNSTRYPCRGGLELRRDESAPQVFASLTEIGAESCYLEAASTLPVGSEVLLLLRTHGVELCGRARVKTSDHVGGMELEFLHLAREDQQKLEYLIGALAGGHETQTEERRVFVPEEPVRIPPAPVTRATPTAQMTQSPRLPSSQPGNSAMSQKIMRAIADLNELEQNLVKDRIDPRLIAQLHDAVEHVRQTARTVQQWADLHSTGGDPFEVLPQLEAERMQMLRKLAHNVTADIDASSINNYTEGISELYESVQQLYRRLRKMLVDEGPES